MRTAIWKNISKRQLLPENIYYLISSYIFWIFLWSKKSHQELSKKKPEETSEKKNFSFSILLFPIWKLMWQTSFMSFNAFLRMLLFSLSFLLQFSLIFISPWRLYHSVVFITKLPDETLVLVIAFLLIKLFKFRYYSFLKDFIWEGLDTEVLSSFFMDLKEEFTLHKNCPWKLEMDIANGNCE